MEGVEWLIMEKIKYNKYYNKYTGPLKQNIVNANPYT